MTEISKVPVADQVSEIAARLREIEAERAKERQAAALPDDPPEVRNDELDF